MTIDTLPDEVLLEIFSFYLVEESEQIEPWHTLVHVCRRWRSIVFASPRRLDIQIFYTPIRRIEVMLCTWPKLPIHILVNGYKENKFPRYFEEDNLITTFKLIPSRICQIQLQYLSFRELERIVLAMQKPFRALTSLTIISRYIPMTVLPQAFLGGSAQHLRSCNLWAVEFPGIWKLLLTANHLVTLCLWHIPHSMYTSPEGMATCLSMMPNLESVHIFFRSPQSLHNQPDQPNRLLSPLTCVVLPSLTEFKFHVMSKYTEDFVSRIDAPLLDTVDILFFNEPILNTPRLHDFLARIENSHSRGAVVFRYSSIEFEIEPGSLLFKLGIECRGLGLQVSSMAQLRGSSFHLPTALKCLCLDGRESNPPLYLLRRQDEVENTQWLDLLHPFTGLKDLHIGKELVLHYALALQELAGERLTEVLPALQNLFIEGLEPSGPIQEALGKFVAARQLSGLPIMVHSWDGQS